MINIFTMMVLVSINNQKNKKIAHCFSYLNRKVKEYNTKNKTFRLNGAPSSRNQLRNIPQSKNNIPIIKKPIIWTFFLPTLSKYCTDNQYPGTAEKEKITEIKQKNGEKIERLRNKTVNRRTYRKEYVSAHQEYRLKHVQQTTYQYLHTKQIKAELKARTQQISTYPRYK